jgi:hypothetical protein
VEFIGVGFGFLALGRHEIDFGPFIKAVAKFRVNGQYLENEEKYRGGSWYVSWASCPPPLSSLAPLLAVHLRPATLGRGPTYGKL